jgi:hypothetical protein
VWEAVDLLEQLLKDTASHTYASLNGWAYPMSRGDMYAAATLARVFNVTLGKNEKPYIPDWQWTDESKAEDVTPDERAALTARLKSKSAFGQKRTEA